MRVLLAILMIASSIRADEAAKQHGTPSPQAKPKAAWEWSIDERIAKRLDPQDIRERAAAEDSDLRKDGFQVEVHGMGPVQFTVDGRRDPELLMPFELFGSLLSGIDPRFRDDTRTRYREKIASFGWQEDAFWQTLEEAASQFEAYQTESLGLQMQLRTLSPPERRKIEPRIQELGYKQCAARADALERVRAKLGREEFNRFLYAVVAPKVSIGSSLPVGDEAGRLRFIEAGCR